MAFLLLIPCGATLIKLTFEKWNIEVVSKLDDLSKRDVPIRIDYSAKYVDLTQGAVAGLLAGLTSLNCSELTLKKIR